ncbi:MAG: Gfo/Idh/MocA family oxidoreductase [Armatimonadota bacterium]|nr:Gfo/Idh/MocA family oxidoreductase [Armatimonadota bacterium]
MKQLKVGIVGAAGRGRGFFSAFIHNPNTRLEAVCDIDEERMKVTAEKVGVSKIYTDYEEMLDKAGIDIAVIGTPMPLHVPQAIMALRRNIHVLSEVPAAVSMDEAKDLVRAVNRSKAKYMMGENYCYMRPNVLVKELARAGLFGEMYLAEGEYVHELKELNEITRWRRKWQTGINGNTYPTHSLGPLLQWMQDRVVSVCCAGTGHHYTDPRGDRYENEDSTTMLCRLAKGGLATIRLDMLSNRPHNMVYYSLQGTDGCYEAPRGLGDQAKIWLKSKSSSVEWTPLSELEQEFLPDWWLHPPKEAIEAGHGGGDYWQARDFVQAILEDKEPPIGIHEAMDMTLPGLVSQQSIERSSEWLPVPNSREWS